MFTNASASLHAALSAANALEVSRDKDLDALDNKTKKSFVNVVKPFADAVSSHSKASSLLEKIPLQRLAVDATPFVDQEFEPLAADYVQSKEKIINDYRYKRDGHRSSVVNTRDKLVMQVATQVQATENLGFVGQDQRMSELVKLLTQTPGHYAKKYPAVPELAVLAEITDWLNETPQRLGSFCSDVHTPSFIGKFDTAGSVSQFKKLAKLLTPTVKEVPSNNGKKASGAIREVTH
jgi:hypothetical protein